MLPFLGALGQNSQNNLNKFYQIYENSADMGLVGNIKMVHEFRSMLVGEANMTDTMNWDTSAIYVFNERGQLTSKDLFPRKENRIKCTYHYDEKGLLTNELSEFIEKNSIFDDYKTEIKYSYDAQGRLLLRESFSNHDTVKSPNLHNYEHATFAYNRKDEVIAFFYEASKLIQKQEETLNSEGRVDTRVRYEYDGQEYQKKSTENYKYDKNGNLITYKNFMNYNLISTQYYYNDKNKKVKEISSTSRYNNKNKKVLSTSTVTEDFKYNEKGQLIEKTVVYPEETKTTTYQYDDQGNWIQRMESNSQSTTLYKRVIQ